MDNKFSGASYEYGTLNKQVLVQKPILDCGVYYLAIAVVISKLRYRTKNSLERNVSFIVKLKSFKILSLVVCYRFMFCQFVCFI